MPNFGFAILLDKCIGCHACTIACKEEHQIPIGVNRCWVKSVEQGLFPNTQRFFLPVLCNQCAAAPCVEICPTNALFKRPDGIVDLYSDSCIGCRACMVACPYDQLFIDPETHTAEKCNFCANRVENGLLPACVGVCPTECRIFGDLDDPGSAVSRIRQTLPVTMRKPEKGTIPKVFYAGAEASAMQPEIARRPYIFKEGQVLFRPLAALSESDGVAGDPRVDYDMPHRQPWGFHMALYLLTKGIATGALLLTAVLWWLGYRDTLSEIIGPAIALLFVGATAVILVADLERPERFLYILLRPNWRSWMVWGAYFLTGHGAVATFWLGAALLGWNWALWALLVPAVFFAVAATSYTGFLFAQGLARDLWQGSHAALDLLAQALAEGAAAMLLAGWGFGASGGELRFLGWILFGALFAHLIFLMFENLLTKSPTLHHELAVRAILNGQYKRLFWGGAIWGGGLIPLAILGVALGAELSMLPVGVGAVLALAGTFAWEYVWVDAGQAVPLS